MASTEQTIWTNSNSDNDCQHFLICVDSNTLISSCLPAWGSLQLWKAKQSAGRKRVSSSASYLWSMDWNCCPQVHCSIKCRPQTTDLSNHQTQLPAPAFTHFLTTHPQPAGPLEGTAHPAVSHRCQDLQRALPWHCCQSSISCHCAWIYLHWFLG